ncbi:ABC transporter ATP-binding protein [Desulforamulus aeronauticus]|uniref:ATP-binding cassette, subfamily B n=1 Tax=Desulforamulus aeronauticus DSM 10349 TaxID=1121421 RepID=A0A1M6QQK1_9FIRM|nr:ABC transporter ATP-binding protein [Desulforamulus aeronauticus]SHK22307.1 ATP-binding cassette, subfamily B [Desulforamulus aeronauticus DSM 10349]
MIQILRKFFRFSGEQRGKFYSAIVISLFHAIFEAIRIPAIAVVLTAIIEDQVTPGTVWTSLGIMLISIIGCTLTRQSMTIRQTIGGYTLTAGKRVEIGERLKYMPMGYFNNNSLGYITSVTTNTCENLQDVATRVIMITLQGVLTTVVITLAVLLYDWRMGLLMMAGLLVFFGINGLMQRKSQQLTPIKTAADSKLVDAVLEYVQGIGVVRSYNLDKTANQTVDQAIRASEDIIYRLEKNFVPYLSLQSFVLKLFGVLMVLVAIALHFYGSLELINCLLMMVASFIIYAQLDAAGGFSALLRLIDLSMDKIDEIFATPVMDAAGKDIVPPTFDLRGEQVSFFYDRQRVIDDVSFILPQGTTTAIVGPSGSGKTTLCHLMARFWDVDSGRITLGGVDVREYTLDSLLKNFSMVFQNVYLFNDTIANNIKFGKSEATMDEVIVAAKKACCHDFIARLPQGYNTVIGEGGATLSGGEKQRLSIARALLKDAPIIILDEATANVDPENEQQLQAALEELTRNKTLVMIAHRLKTVQNADQILVLEGGRIVQRGTHAELTRQRGIYADFINVRQRAIGWKLKTKSI